MFPDYKRTKLKKTYEKKRKRKRNGVQMLSEFCKMFQTRCCYCESQGDTLQ